MNTITANSFAEEVIKLAQNVFVDPREAEMEERSEFPPPRNKDLNREVLKQHLKNTAAIALGTGAGIGLAEGSIYGLEKGFKKLRGMPPPKWLPNAMRLAVIPAMATGAYAAHRAMRNKADSELEKARIRGSRPKATPVIEGNRPQLEGL